MALENTQALTHLLSCTINDWLPMAARMSGWLDACRRCKLYAISIAMLYAGVTLGSRSVLGRMRGSMLPG